MAKTAEFSTPRLPKIPSPAGPMLNSLSAMNLLRRPTGPARLDSLHGNDAPSAGESGRAGGDAVGLVVRAMALAGLALALGASVGMLVD